MFQILELFFKIFFLFTIDIFTASSVNTHNVHKYAGYDPFARFCLFSALIHCARHRLCYRPTPLAVCKGTRSHIAATWIYLRTCVGKPVIRDIIPYAVNPNSAQNSRSHNYRYAQIRHKRTEIWKFQTKIILYYIEFINNNSQYALPTRIIFKIKCKRTKMIYSFIYCTKTYLMLLTTNILDKSSTRSFSRLYKET